MAELITVNSKKPVSIKENLISHKRKTDFRSNSSPVNQILYLQRTIGNQAVQRMVRSGALQAKLSIGQPEDVYEQEADRVADAVMRMPEPGVQREVEPEEEEEKVQAKSLAEEITPLVQKQIEPEEEEEEEMLQAKSLAKEIIPLAQRQVDPEEEEEELQAKATSDNISEVNPNLESQIQSLKGGGKPLSENDRAFFEPRFGRDFSQVRVHTDANAADSAQAVNARAFTVGQDVVFGAGHYAPGRTTGQRLLAHELTHVVQQNSGVSQIKNIDRQELNVHSIGKGKYIQRKHISKYKPTYSPKHWDYTFKSNGHIIATAKKGANLGGLARYWSWKGENYKKITHANGSKVKNPNLIYIGDQFDVFPIMPAFYRRMVGKTGVGNCGNAACAYLGMCSGPGNNTRAQDFKFFKQLSAGATSYAGNVVVFSTTGSTPRSAKELKHFAIYLGNNYVFTKNGMGPGQYRVMLLSSVSTKYGTSAGVWHK